MVHDEEVGFGDSSLHLSLSDFTRHVDALARTHEFVDLDDALASGPADRPRVVLTFDDAYRGAVTLALPELQRRGLPAVVFVAPALLGSASTWWDELAQAGLLSDATRREALIGAKGLGPAVRERFLGAAPVPSLPSTYGIATREELLRNCHSGITVGSHTWAHEYLPALETDEMKISLRRSAEWLRESAAPSSDWLALPYGAGSMALGNVALQLGHSGVLRIDGGLCDAAIPRAGVPRINVPAGVALRSLELRTSGLLRR